jgi:hypothetical protein
LFKSVIETERKPGRQADGHKYMLFCRLDFDYKTDIEEPMDPCCHEMFEEIQFNEIAFFDVILAALGAFSKS